MYSDTQTDTYVTLKQIICHFCVFFFSI